MNQTELKEKRKKDILNHIYGSFFRVEITRTTKYDLIDFYRKNQYFLKSRMETIGEYKRFVLFRWCIRMGVLRDNFITKEDVIDFLKSKKKDNPVHIPELEVLDFVFNRY